MSTRPTVVALYLPQYHPIPENDAWWEPGFTEWTNVAKAKPLFSGHHQPNLPADLGFYDLRVPETRASQAQMARAHGVGAFCYYHYWFGNGRRLLERPFQEVLQSGQPDLPFMLCWANQTWAGVWHGLAGQVLVEQTYPGDADTERHFEELLPAFKDPRYLRVEGKPVFMIYRPTELPDPPRTLALWKRLANKAGLPGLYLLGEHSDPFWNAKANGYDAFVNMRALQRRRAWVPWSKPIEKLKGKVLDALKRPTVAGYADLADYFVPDSASDDAIPCVLPGWDNTPRSGSKGLVLVGSTPDAFAAQLNRALARAGQRGRDQLVFVKSWNEWAEGNHLEPGRRYGYGHLKVLQRSLVSRYGP
jgi:hypothetical protein